VPQFHFTSHLQRHLVADSAEVPGATVREALENLFRETPRLRSYIVDDQGRLRRHVNIFVDGEAVRDRDGLSDAVRADTEVYVLQALSGG